MAARPPPWTNKVEVLDERQDIFPRNHRPLSIQRELQLSDLSNLC